MRANSPSAIFASITLHGLVAVAIALLTILLTRQEQTPPVIFELVAGEVTDATERAPTTTAVKFDVPKTTPRPPEPRPVREERVEPPPVPKPVEKKAEPKKVPKVEEKKAPPKEEKKLTYEEFVKQHGKPEPKVATTPPRQTRVPRVDTSKITSSTPTTGERGRTQSRAEADAMTVYLAALRDRLKDAHDETKPAGLGDTVSAEVSFVLAANGEISNVRIARSSGFPEFDQSVLEAFRRITWPGARPDRRTETMRLTFRMREQ